MTAPEFSRRTLVASVAWTVPVVALAVAAPAAAASPTGVQMGFKYNSFSNTFGGLYRGGIQAQVSGPPTNQVVKSLLVTVTLVPVPTTIEDLYIDESNGWTVITPYNPTTGKFTLAWNDSVGINSAGGDYYTSYTGFGYNNVSGPATTQFDAVVTATNALTGAQTTFESH